MRPIHRGYKGFEREEMGVGMSGGKEECDVWCGLWLGRRPYFRRE